MIVNFMDNFHSCIKRLNPGYSVMRKLLILLILFLSDCPFLFAQPNADSLRFFQIINKGRDCYNRNAYDSAFAFYKQGYEWAIQKNFLGYYSATGCLVDMGHCLYNQRKYPQAHQYYYEALLNARKYSHHKDLKIKAIKFLHAVHDLIQTYNLPFKYPAPESFTEQVVFFDVDSVLWQQGDTALIRIKAGLYDGVILGKNKAASVYSIKNVATGEQSTYLGTAEIRDVGNNKSMAMARLKDTAKIKVGWQVQVLANVPESVSNSAILNVFRLNLKWRGNDSYLNLFNRRYFSYFNDSSYTRDLMDILRSELSDVVTRLGPDTLKPDAAVSKISDDGIFRGKNMVRALNETNGAHVNYFLRLLVEYPFEYMGVPYRFSELYASWVLGNTPLQKNDVKDFILGNEKISDEMIARAKLVSAQVQKENIVDSWIDDGLAFADKNYWKDLLSQARLLYHYGRATNRLDYRAWADFFDAIRLKDYGRHAKADSLLKASYENFQSAGSAEGMQWISSVRNAVLDSAGIQMNIQRSHNLHYDIVPSPNERYFATAGDDRTIKIWDITLGKQIKSIEAHNYKINHIAYNPGGRYLASVSEDSTIKIWNTFTYGLMNIIRTPKEHRYLSFSPDGKTLLSAGKDSILYFWDPFTGVLKSKTTSPGGNIRRFSFITDRPDLLYLQCQDSALYSLDISTGITKQLLKSQKQVWWLKISKGGKYLCYYTSDSSFHIYNLEGGRYVFGDKFIVWDFVDSRYFSTGDFSPNEKYYVFMRPDTTTVLVNLDQRLSVPFYSYIKSQYVFNNSGKYFISQYAGAPAVVDVSTIDFNKAYSLFYGNATIDERTESYNLLREKDFQTGNSPVMDMRFTDTNNTLQIFSYGTYNLDLSSGKSTMLYPDPPWVSPNSEWPIAENISLFRKTSINDTIFIFDNKVKTELSKIWLPEKEHINAVAFFNNDSKCLISGKKGTLTCWDLSTGKIDYSISNTGGTKASIMGMQKVPGTMNFILLRERAKPYVLNAAKGIIIDSLSIGFARGIAFSNEKFWLTDSTGKLFSGFVNNMQALDTLGFKSTSSFFDLIRLSKNGKYLMLLDVPYCHLLDAESGKIVQSLKPDLSNLQSMTISPDNLQLFVGSMNGEIIIYSIESGKQVSRIYLPNPSEPIFTDSEGHYLASKTALQHVVFTKGYRTFNYEQFDVDLNQPHKVLAAIGRADEATLSAYEKAWEKRMKKNGIGQSNNDNASAPSIIIHNRTAIKPSTSQPYYTIKTECYDLKDKLGELKVFVNDVPLKDSLFNLVKFDTTSIILNIAIPLTPGNNRIKIYCLNKSGRASYKEFIDIYNSTSAKTQKTWFIGLGVANYADTSNNLTYSVKDIRDLVKKFKSIYPELMIDTLMNKQVTLKNIEALKNRLKKIEVSDRVIMAVTGHGLLSDKLDFYYATYDINFSKPEEKGLPYDQLEEILNETAARQKLLLIDACHSGLVDKDHVVQVKSVVLTEDSVNGAINIKETRGIKPKVTQKVDEANTFSLMQNMFADFSNDNGIVVISAAGGLEYALESARWNNGVFTYSVLKGLEGEADKALNGGNNDYKISVQELMRYVSTMVPELTKGKQQPTSRRENLEFNWIIK